MTMSEIEIETIKATTSWNRFSEWANGHGINLDHIDDWGPWWTCWAAARMSFLE